MFIINKNKESIDETIKEAIIKTVAYFDMFDFPQTDFEIWRFLLLTPNDAKLRQVTLSEVKEILGRDIFVETKNGFYFLKGRDEIIKIRNKRVNFAERKMKRALRISKIYSFLPWIKMIAVANIMGENNFKDESDIDIFIISEKNKIWLTRFFCVGIAKILGLRPSEKNFRDKICLSFYLSEEEMNLGKFVLNGEPSFPRKRESRNAESDKDVDIYFIYWLANLIPIYNRDKAYKKFIQANVWLKNYLPNWQPAMPEKIIKAEGNKIFGSIINFLFGRLEGVLKKIQIKAMPNVIKEMANKDTRVVINDRVLKFHIKDRREEYQRNYETRVIKIINQR